MNDGRDQASSGTSAVEELVFEFLDRRENEGVSVLEELCRRAPEHAARLRARVAALERAGLIAGTPVDALPEKLGDFRVTRRLGSGGMGVVFLAEQQSLGRRAAVKVVRPEHLWLPGARDRFRREALAVAQLAHPGIVSVFTVGEETGVPFLAMEYVEGATLADLVADLRTRSVSELTGTDLRAALDARLAREGVAPSGAAGPNFEGSWTTVVTRVAIGVAHALAHAHARGVLHRDLKPSNVLLDREGRPRLFDFGLATQAGAERITRTGSQMGSMPYMSPEQVEGRPTEIDERTDVYGLAVTLYEVASLRLPYEDRSTVALARRIVDGQAPPLRRVNPKAPVDLETVVAKAMERDPRRRYASVTDFARDLENVLAHRPIEARRQGAATRTLRWCQRHPARAVAGGLAAIVVVGGPLLVAWKERDARLKLQEETARTEAANRQLQDALEEARFERRNAEENFSSAVDAVSFLTDVGTTQLADLPEADEARRLILEGALQFHQALAARRRDRPELVLDLSRTEVRVGEILNALARDDEAEIVLGSTANALLRRMERESDRATQRLASDALVKHARALAALGRHAEAARRFEEGIAIVQRFPEAEATRADVESWAESERDLGVALQMTGDRSGALQALDRSGRVYAGLLARDPDDPVLQAAVARAYVEFMDYRVGYALQDGAESVSYQQAYELLEQAVPRLRTRARAGKPGGAEQRDFANALVDHGMVSLALGHGLQAEDRLYEALPYLREIARRHRLVAKDQMKLSRALNALHLIYANANCHAEAVAIAREAIEWQRRIVDDFPDRLTARAGLGILLANMANDQDRLEQLPEAWRTAEEAIAVLSDYSTRMPGDELARTTATRARAVAALEAADLGDVVSACEQALRMETHDSAEFELMRAACWSRIEERARRLAPNDAAAASLADEALERMYADVERAAARGRTSSHWWRSGPLLARHAEPRFKPSMARLKGGGR